MGSSRARSVVLLVAVVAVVLLVGVALIFLLNISVRYITRSKKMGS